MPSIKRVLLFAATALHIGVSVSSPIQPPQPVCTSCAEWCAGSCSFGGPAVNGHVNSRQLQNITVYRMTAANVTDLDFKNTGDPAGDLDFNMDERAIPLVCRHSATASSTPDCIEGNTHSWLLDSRLVYLQWVIEVDGMWGPYQMCNLNLTNSATGRAGDGKWSCRGASFDSGNFTDRELCGTCERTGRAVGWKYMNASSATKAHAPRMPSAQCNATFQRVCAGQTSFKNCTSCYSRHRRAELSPACNGSYNYMSQLCPRPPTPSAACNASAEQLCGHFRTSPAMHKNCSRCLQNHSLSLEDGPCGHDGEVHSLLLKNGFCTAPASNNWWHTKSNDTWVGPQQLHMNHGKMVRMMGGSWFSTTKDGRCDTAKGQRPGDGSGCSWRPVELKKAVNYSCVQGHVAQQVLMHGRSCFSRCPDGTNPNPLNASDCWLRCFFNSFLGNSSLGLAEMTSTPLVQAWERSFAGSNESAGGCPPAAITPPPY